MATVECQGMGDGRSCCDRSSTSFIISSGLGHWYLQVNTGSLLPCPSCLLYIHAGNSERHSGPISLGTSHCLGLASSLGFYPGKDTRSSLIPRIIPNLSEIFIITLHSPSLGGLVWQGQSARGGEAPKFSAYLLQLPSFLQPRECLSFSSWGTPSINILPNPLLVHICPCRLPEDLGCCDSEALNWLLFSLSSALSHLPWGDVYRNAKRTGQGQAKRKKEILGEQKSVSISKYFTT